MDLNILKINFVFILVTHQTSIQKMYINNHNYLYLKYNKYLQISIDKFIQIQQMDYPIEQVKKFYQKNDKQNYTIVYLLGMTQTIEKTIPKLLQFNFFIDKDILFLQPDKKFVQLTDQEEFAWYAVNHLDGDNPERYNQDHVRTSKDEINQVIFNKQIINFHEQNNRDKKVYLMGFSQGACMSLCISLERSFSGGVFTTGGIFFPFLKEIKVKNSILAYCGDQDIKYPKNIFLDSFENFKNELPVQIEMEKNLKHVVSEKFLSLCQLQIEKSVEYKL